jgi:hypothetical protein
MCLTLFSSASCSDAKASSGGGAGSGTTSSGAGGETTAGGQAGAIDAGSSGGGGTGGAGGSANQEAGANQDAGESGPAVAPGACMGFVKSPFALDVAELGLSFGFGASVAPQLVQTGNPERVVVIGRSPSNYLTYYRFVAPWGDWNNGQLLGQLGNLDNTVYSGTPAPGFGAAFELLVDGGYVLAISEGQPVPPRKERVAVGVTKFLTRLPNGFLAGGTTNPPCPPPMGGNPPCYNWSPNWAKLNIAETNAAGALVAGTDQLLGCSNYLLGPNPADAVEVDGGQLIAVVSTPDVAACNSESNSSPGGVASTRIVWRSSAGVLEPGGTVAASNLVHLFARSDGAWLIHQFTDPSGPPGIAFSLIGKRGQVRSGANKLPLAARATEFPTWIGGAPLGDRLVVAVNFAADSSVGSNPQLPLPVSSAIELLNENGELVSSIETPALWAMVASPSGKSILVVTGDPATRADLVRYDCISAP